MSFRSRYTIERHFESENEFLSSCLDAQKFNDKNHSRWAQNYHFHVYSAVPRRNINRNAVSMRRLLSKPRIRLLQSLSRRRSRFLCLGRFLRLQLLSFRFQLLVMLKVFRVFVKPVRQILDGVPWAPIRNLHQTLTVVYGCDGAIFLPFLAYQSKIKYLPLKVRWLELRLIVAPNIVLRRSSVAERFSLHI